MARPNHRGAYRTAIGYVLIVMGGTFLLVMSALNLWAAWQDKSYGHNHRNNPGVVAVFGFNLKLFLRLVCSPFVLLWLFAGALVYLCGLLLQKLKVPILSRLILAAVSAYLSSKIIMFVAPVGWPSLASVYFTFFWTGLIAAAFGFFLYPHIGEESFQTAPLGRGYKLLLTAWALLFAYAWGHTAYTLARIHATKDPEVRLVFAKWSPEEGDLHEELNKAIDPPFHYLTDLEIQELRAAGLTGILRGYGGSVIPAQAKRLVVIMAHPVRETVDLPKPASGDILYLQTQQGWKVFPPGSATVPRTLRLTYLDPTPMNNVATTNYSLDIGLGHPKEPSSYAYAFSWLRDEFEAPIPAPPAQSPGTN